MLARLQRIGFFAAILSCASVTFAGAQILYGIDRSGDQLVTINRSTGAGAVVGPLGIAANSAGADFDNSGVLWALIDPESSTESNLYTIDTGTGAATFVVTLDRQITGRGIAFGPDGVTLYTTSGTQVYEVDTGTGATTLIGSMSIGTSNLASSQAGEFYCTSTGSLELMSLDITTAASNPLGVMMGSPATLTCDDGAGKLLSVSSSLYEIDPADGSSVEIGPVGIANAAIVAIAYFDAATPTMRTPWGRLKRLYR